MTTETARPTFATTRTGPAFNKPAYKYVRESDRLPGSDEAHDTPDPMVRVKLFNPTGGQTWWIAGIDADGLAFGAVNLGWGIEVGDLDLNEIIAVRGMFGLPVERDIGWEPRRLSVLLAEQAKR